MTSSRRCFRGIIGTLIGCVTLLACRGIPPVEAPSPTSSRYVVSGSGQPTIVLQASINEGHGTWDGMLGQLGEISTTIAYSRMGYFTAPSTADALPPSRTPAEINRALDDVLAEAGLSPPLLLVAHSASAAYALRYGVDHPDRVAGLVLIDPLLPGYVSACEEAGFDHCRPTEMALRYAPSHVASEMRGLAATEADFPNPSELGVLPVTVIGAARLPANAPRGSFELWLTAQEEFVAGLANGRMIRTTAGHYVHREQPDVVIEAVRERVGG